uniref:Uncharacterized protein n=1 Tax=Arundo donax TaxID=35708 RepID=A0A0A8Y7S2_ARUDO
MKLGQRKGLGFDDSSDGIQRSVAQGRERSRLRWLTEVHALGAAQHVHGRVASDLCRRSG